VKKLTICMLALTLALAAEVGWAQRGGDDTGRASDVPAEETPPADETEEQSTPPKAIADGALKDLSAWRHAVARAELEQHQAEIGDTIPFLTAWSYLLATERQLDEALTKLQTATDGDPSDPVAPYLLGEVRLWKNQRDSANQAWQKARTRAQSMVDASPEDARARYWLGASLIKLGEFEAARTNLTQALDKGFSPAMTNFQIGLSWAYQRQWNKSVAAFDGCLEADNGFAHAYYYRARSYKELGNTEQMLIDLDRFLDLAPDAREATAARSMLRAGG
jgi:tetratricopeptide (TPR) repeat protein